MPNPPQGSQNISFDYEQTTANENPASESSSTTQNQPHDSDKYEKITFALFVVIVILLGLLGWVFLSDNNMALMSKVPKTSDGTRNDEMSPTVTCDYDGQTYQVGEGFPSSDGCNICSCGESGDVACTLMACENDQEPIRVDETEANSSSLKTEAGSKKVKRIYANEFIQFEYPPELFSLTSSMGFGQPGFSDSIDLKPTEEYILDSLSQKQEYRTYYDFSILRLPKEENDNQTFTALERVKGSERTSLANCGNDKGSSSPIQTIYFSGAKAYEFSEEGCVPKLARVSIFFDYKGDTFWISYTYPTDSDPEYKNNIEQIISTFKLNY